MIKFVNLLVTSFKVKLNDNFFNTISKELGFAFPSYLKRKISRWTENDFQEKGGRDKLSLE